MRYLLCLLLLVLSGCFAVRTELQFDPAVEAAAYGDDCTAIIFGIGFGANSLEAAKREAGITRIRSITYSHRYIMFAGDECVEVLGEPEHFLRRPSP